LVEANGLSSIDNCATFVSLISWENRILSGQKRDNGGVSVGEGDLSLEKERRGASRKEGGNFASQLIRTTKIPQNFTDHEDANRKKGLPDWKKKNLLFESSIRPFWGGRFR